MANPLDTLIHGYRYIWRGATKFFQRKNIVFDPSTFSVADDPNAANGDGATVITGLGGGGSGFVAAGDLDGDGTSQTVIGIQNIPVTDPDGNPANGSLLVAGSGDGGSQIFFGSVSLSSSNAVNGVLNTDNGGTGFEWDDLEGNANKALLVNDDEDGFVLVDTIPLAMLTADDDGLVVGTAETKQLATTTTDTVDVVARIQTTSATVATLYSWTIDDNAVTTIDVRVTAAQSTGGTCDAWVGTMSVKSVSGTVTVVDASDITHRGTSAWVVALDNSGTTARLRITGAAATTIEWGATVSRQVTRFS